MKSNETRVNEMIDEAGTPPAGRQVRIVNGPVVLAAPHSSEGQRRFIVVTGTVVLDRGDTVPVHDGTQPLRSSLAQRRAVFAGLAVRG